MNKTEVWQALLDEVDAEWKATVVRVGASRADFKPLMVRVADLFEADPSLNALNMIVGRGWGQHLRVELEVRAAMRAMVIEEMSGKVENSRLLQQGRAGVADMITKKAQSVSEVTEKDG